MGDVIKLGEKRESIKEGSEEKSEAPETDFDAVMKANAEKKRRMDEERKKANKGVIRSYRLKH